MNLSSLLSRPGLSQATSCGTRRVGRFFRYHGAFAPGVRLMRRLSLRDKALLVGVAFCAPLVPLVSCYLGAHPLPSGGTVAMLAGLAASLAVAFYLLMSLHRVVGGGLEQLRALVDQIAEGDLSARPQPWGQDELAEAMVAMRASLSRLAALFAEVRQGVGAVSHASQEIAGRNSHLAQRNGQSVDAIAQITEGVTRYVEQLQACGRRVDAAADTVDAMRLASLRNRDSMDKLQRRMGLLHDKSRDIAEIVEVIDGVAFRTNILALNASVEAAKAGDAGRGFAVVAQEVRSLAMRTAESSRRISAIIGGAGEDIEQAKALAELAGRAIADADADVARIHATMAEIVAFTHDGQRTSQTLLAEIRGLNDSTAQSGELVSQLAQASVALSAQGERLSQEVGSFKLAAER